MTRVEQAKAFENRPAGPMTRVRIENLENEIDRVREAEGREFNEDESKALVMLAAYRRQCRG